MTALYIPFASLSNGNVTRKDMALSAISMNSALADKRKTINQSFLHKQQCETISRTRNSNASLTLRKT